MLVVIKKKGGTRIKGVKCGTEGGLLYLANPWEQTPCEDGEDGFMEGPIGEEIQGGRESIRLILIPVADIDVVESVNR